MENIKIKPVHEGFVTLAKATPGAAAYDLRVPEDIIIKPGRQIVPMGFKIEIPYGYEGIIDTRSGFSAKGMEDVTGGRMDADVLRGKIDSDYRGVVGVIVNSHEKDNFVLAKGTRIAQMTFYKVEDVCFDLVEELSETERDGGFGSTGTK